MKLAATDLDYDPNYLYLFSNGTIPYYETAKGEQGWYTSYGKKCPMKGKAQILEFFGEKILLKNYNNNEIYFIDSEGNQLSESYKDIFVCDDGKFIIKDKDGFMDIINEEYKTVLNKKYAVINPRLVEEKIYLVLDSTENIKSNDYNIANIKWNLMDENGQILQEDLEYVYDQVFEIPTDSKSKEENYKKFEENLKDLKYKFVGDKFYLNYK